jgi:3'(2'), 5'-bisphosphate nucleotidase
MEDKRFYLLQIACDAALAAGLAILEIYDSGFEVSFKVDESPVTSADKRASEVIKNFLNKTSIKVICEEGDGHKFEEREEHQRIWLVDPIDGTKEFIKRNGEFTVNIALIENGKPVLGVVYAPVLEILYLAAESIGAVKLETCPPTKKIDLLESLFFDSTLKLPLQHLPEVYTVAVSRSYFSNRLNTYIETLEAKHKTVTTLKSGSSLKFCYLAEGKAHEYPRFGSIMEWDTAAGQCVLYFSGGQVLDMTASQTLQYNKTNLKNPEFIAFAKGVNP